MTDWHHEAGPWLTRYTPAGPTGERAQLICFPHAGGSATYFQPLARELAARPAAPVEVLAVQYPGRQERRAEPLIEDLSVLADRIAEALKHAAGAPLVLFGHSMGALLAWEVARRLDGDGVVPRALIVSGRGAPALYRDVRLHRRTDDELTADLRYLSGTSAQLLTDPGVLEMVLPVLRGDYRVVDGFRYEPGPPLSCPISVFLGDRDPWAREREARGWQAETTAGVSFRSFPGEHFYLASQWGAVAEAIADLPLS
ncbi:thioesterase II family protein [Streptomyces formicae]